MIGSSGAAPAELLERRGFDALGFSEFRHWPIHRIGEIDHEEYGHGDGGHLENLAIMPLLAREVKNIIVFINTKTKFRPRAQRDPYAGSLEPLFRAVTDKHDGRAKFMTNKVFGDDGKFDALIAGLKAKQLAKQTLIHCDTYSVHPNPNYGIQGGNKVNVCWIYNEDVPKWSCALSSKLQDLVGGLRRFPHYRTFFQNRPMVIDLSIEEVNALAHLSCWNVTANESTIRRHFGL